MATRTARAPRRTAAAPAPPPAPAAPERVDPWWLLLSELDWWIETHGSAYVPQGATSRVVAGQPYPLGRRLTQRRHEYRTGRLSSDKIRDLESRQGWSWSGFAPRAEQAWTSHLATVRQYVTEHGTLDKLERHHPVASRWLRVQRTANLTSAQRRELSAIPGALEQRKVRLADFVAAVRAWMAQESGRDACHLRLSTVYDAGAGEPVPLGKRAEYWRARRVAGRLSDEAVQAIEALPGWDWTPGQTRAARAAAAKVARASSSSGRAPRRRSGSGEQAVEDGALDGQGA